MLVSMLEKEIKRFKRLFEQDDANGTVSDLGEPPEVVLKDDTDPDAGEVVGEIDNLVDSPYRQDFIAKLAEKIGEGWSFEVDSDDPDIINVTVDDDKKFSMNFVIDLGEPLVLFRAGDKKLTLSLYPIFQKTFVDTGDLYEELSDDDEALNVFIDGLKETADEMVGVQMEEEPEADEEIETEVENEEDEEDEEEAPDTSESKKRVIERRKIERMKHLKRMKEDDNYIDNVDLDKYADDNRKATKTTYTVTHVADDKTEFKKVEPQFEKAEIASKAFDKMTMQDPNKKVTQGPDGYPNLYGFMTEPKKQ